MSNRIDCVRNEYRSAIKTFVLAIVGFVVALAINEAILAIINKYFSTNIKKSDNSNEDNEYNITGKIIYAVSAFAIALIILWLIVKYVMPKTECKTLCKQY